MCLLNAYCGLSPAALYGEQERKSKDVTCKFSMIKGIITLSVKQLCQHDLII